MSETNVDLSQVQENPQHEPQQPIGIDSPTKSTPNTAAATEHDKQKQALDADLVRAKLGVERFKATYEAGDEEWKRLLTETPIGKAMQAMYLGLKPMCSTEDIQSNDQDMLIQNFQQVSIPGLDTCIGRGQNLVFDANHVARVIAAYPQYFPDYTPGTPISAYLARYVLPLQERTTPRELEYRQLGLLFGFPPNTVEQFARHGNARSKLTTDLYTSEELSPEDEAVLLGLNGGSYEHPDSMEEFHANVNRYIDVHQAEIRAMLERRYSDMDEETKQYILTLRYVDLPGLGYRSGNPIPEDKAFEQRIRDIFEQSGMNAFLASRKA